jgi:hypothetical protein
MAERTALRTTTSLVMLELLLVMVESAGGVTEQFFAGSQL